jgi:hypothetical protein
MRRWLMAALLMLAAASWAHGGESACAHPNVGKFSAEWMERGELRGARIEVDPKWALYPSIDTVDVAFCETCDGDQIRKVYLWFWASDTVDHDVDKETPNGRCDFKCPLPNSVPTATPCL